MITSTFLFLLYGVIFIITAPLRVLPNVSLPAFLSGTISSISSYISTGYSWFPITVTAILSSWGIYIGIEAAIFLYKGFMWVIKKIPGIK